MRELFNLHGHRVKIAAEWTVAGWNWRLQLDDGPILIGTHPATGSEFALCDRLRRRATHLIAHRYYL